MAGHGGSLRPYWTSWKTYRRGMSTAGLNFTPVQGNLDLLHRHFDLFLLALYSTERPAEVTAELWYKKTRFTTTSFSCRSEAREQELNNKLSEALLRAEKAESGGSNLPCLVSVVIFLLQGGITELHSNLQTLRKRSSSWQRRRSAASACQQNLPRCTEMPRMHTSSWQQRRRTATVCP